MTKLDYSVPSSVVQKNLEKQKQLNNQAKTGIDKQKVALNAMNVPQQAAQLDVQQTQNKGFGRTV